MSNQKQYDVVISGAGSIGLVSALLISELGYKVALVDPKSLPQIQQKDNSRNIALMQSSLNVLKHLNLFDQFFDSARPLSELRIIDASDRILRAPEILFKSSELGYEYFALNVPMGKILSHLADEVVKRTEIDCYFKNQIVEHEKQTDQLMLELKDGSVLYTKLLIGADGRMSQCRDYAGIQTNVKKYPQMALGFSFFHERDLGDISIEFHRKSGPFTLIPMKNPSKGGYQTSLVWSEKEDEAKRIASLDEAEICKMVEEIANGVTGKVTGIDRIATFPLTNTNVDKIAQNRIMLVGEAAHILPPIGAQGMNLGFQDAAQIYDLLKAAKSDHKDIGSDEILSQYNKARKLDIGGRGKAVDILNISLLSDDIWMQFMRGFGLFGLKKSAKLREQVMQKALYPMGKMPSLMEPRN